MYHVDQRAPTPSPNLASFLAPASLRIGDCLGPKLYVGGPTCDLSQVSSSISAPPFSNTPTSILNLCFLYNIANPLELDSRT